MFNVSRDLRKESSYKRKSLGTGVRFGYDLSEYLSHGVSYRISRERVSDIASDASLAVKEQEGSRVKSELGQGLVYDTRDSRFSPREGMIVRYNLDLAGLGGSVKYVRNRVNAVQYFPLSDDIVGSVGVGGGYIYPLEDITRLIDRFYLGGATLRGFKNFGVGPRDTVSEDALGGDWFYTGTGQVTFPIGLPSELGIRGRAFTDLGSLGKAESDTISNVNDTGSLRMSVGLGISWSSPFGPVSMDFARAVLREDFDETEVFRFNFGTRF